MDNVTHSLTGLMLSRAGLERFHAHAPLALILSANAPDVDGISIFWGPLAYIRFHRGLAHAVPFIPVMAVLPLLIVCGLRRNFQGWARLYLLCIAGVASHLLLDWTNTYGVRFLLPFSPQWFHLDLNALVDLWILAVLLFAWLIVYVFRMVNAEIGAKPGSGRALAICALLLMLGYDFGKLLLHQRAIEVLNSRIYEGSAPLRVTAFPAGSNPLEWHGWIETRTLYKEYTWNVTAQFDPGAGATFYKPEDAAAIAAASVTPVFRTFLGFDQYPRWSLTPLPEPEGGKRVELHDLRLSFRASAIVDHADRVLRSWLQL